MCRVMLVVGWRFDEEQRVEMINKIQMTSGDRTTTLEGEWHEFGNSRELVEAHRLLLDIHREIPADPHSYRVKKSSGVRGEDLKMSDTVGCLTSIDSNPVDGFGDVSDVKD